MDLFGWAFGSFRKYTVTNHEVNSARIPALQLSRGSTSSEDHIYPQKPLQALIPISFCSILGSMRVVTKCWGSPSP